uniref:Uncharacterized protein n=1 Tax=Onchocerca volvulus TaxID=6282 RepID=A0A8R1XP10_ONCVO
MRFSLSLRRLRHLTQFIELSPFVTHSLAFGMYVGKKGERTIRMNAYLFAFGDNRSFQCLLSASASSCYSMIVEI